MNQDDRREYLIEELLKEEPQYARMRVPENAGEQKRLLRSLMNICPPRPVSDKVLEIQDEYLREEAAARGIIDSAALPASALDSRLVLWRGDITTLKVDAIVNAANSGMTGCYVPNHRCIDNCIHTFAGVQLRLYCEEMMEAQGHAEPTGQAKITPAYNLPCRYVLHTVGPIVGGRLTETHCRQLADCYRSCLSLAAENELKSVAFCCISTGEFHFPNEKAAEIAVATVKEFLAQNKTSVEKVIFNVFKDRDREIYEELLGEK